MGAKDLRLGVRTQFPAVVISTIDHPDTATSGLRALEQPLGKQARSRLSTDRSSTPDLVKTRLPWTRPLPELDDNLSLGPPLLRGEGQPADHGAGFVRASTGQRRDVSSVMVGRPRADGYSRVMF